MAEVHRPSFQERPVRPLRALLHLGEHDCAGGHPGHPEHHEHPGRYHQQRMCFRLRGTRALQRQPAVERRMGHMGQNRIGEPFLLN